MNLFVPLSKYEIPVYDLEINYFLLSPLQALAVLNSGLKEFPPNRWADQEQRKDVDRKVVSQGPRFAVIPKTWP